jgi:indolepyruvate ferredoxin oxidoreductase beta subunit
VLLGAVARRLEIADRYWRQALDKMVPKRFLEENLKAFAFGYES